MSDRARWLRLRSRRQFVIIPTAWWAWNTNTDGVREVYIPSPLETLL